jgi:hypothetical protein
VTDDAERRQLGAWLIIGVLAVPVIFAWFTLRRGYSAHIRRGAFLYAAMGLVSGLGRLG